jgi:hypothetical protein
VLADIYKCIHADIYISALPHKIGVFTCDLQSPISREGRGKPPQQYIWLLA